MLLIAYGPLTTCPFIPSSPFTSPHPYEPLPTNNPHIRYTNQPNHPQLLHHDHLHPARGQPGPVLDVDDHGVGDDGDRGADDGVNVCDLYDAGCVWVVRGAGTYEGCGCGRCCQCHIVWETLSEHG